MRAGRDELRNQIVAAPSYRQFLFWSLPALALLSGGCVCMDAVARLQVKGCLNDRLAQPVGAVPVVVTLCAGATVVRPSPIQTHSDSAGRFEADCGYTLYGGTVPCFCLWLPPRAPEPPKFDSIEITSGGPRELRQGLLVLNPRMLVRTDRGAILNPGTVTLGEAPEADECASDNLEPSALRGAILRPT